MKIVVKKSSVDRGVALLAADALRARLFVPGWMLSDELNDIKSLRNTSCYETTVVVAYLGGVAIGVCTSRQYRGCKNPNIMVFVRKKHRRCGIGTKLIVKATSRRPSFGYATGGIDGADRFFSQFRFAATDY